MGLGTTEGIRAEFAVAQADRERAAEVVLVRSGISHYRIKRSVLVALKENGTLTLAEVLTLRHNGTRILFLDEGGREVAFHKGDSKLALFVVGVGLRPIDARRVVGNDEPQFELRIVAADAEEAIREAYAITPLTGSDNAERCITHVEQVSRIDSICPPYEPSAASRGSRGEDAR